MRLKYIFFILFTACTTVLFAQNRTISGTVKDSKETIIGALVSEKGLVNNTAITDMDGKFNLSLKGNSNVLIIKALGYLAKEFTVPANQNTVSILLEQDVRGLEEVVVIGYGTTTKQLNASSLSTVTEKEIRQTPGASVQNMLTGKLPGFFSQQRGGQPGDDGANFVIRGASSFVGSQNPLILVDDIEYDYARFSTIDPNEIASVSILKDAASTSIYGIRGANGVVLVTTKRGENGPAKINVRTEYGVQNATMLPEFLDAYQTAVLRNEASRNDGLAEPFSALDLELYKNGKDPYLHPNIDWYNTLFKSDVPMAKTNFDVSGGTDKVKYLVSAGYLSQDGMLRDFNTDENIDSKYSYNRYNFRSNLDFNPTKSTSIKFDISGNYAKENRPDISTPGATQVAEAAVFFELMNYQYLNPYIYNITNPNGTFGFSSPKIEKPINNANNIVGRLAVGGYRRDISNTLSFNLSGNQKLDKITKGLSAKVNVSSLTFNSVHRELSRATFPSYTYNPESNTYIPFDANIYKIDPYSLSYDGGTPTRQFVLQGLVNYTREFGKHGVSALVLYNQSTQQKGTGNVETNYIPSNFRGYTFRTTYNYNLKYLLELSGAYNGSDQFVEPYGFFPAAAIGWNLGEESFIKNNVKFIDLLKFRVSYGISGSDDLGQGNRFRYQSIYSAGPSYSFGDSHNSFAGIVEGTLGNDGITWQKERKLNFGVDFSLFKGKLNGSAEYFDNYRYDILTTRKTITDLTGIATANLPPVNIGEVSNKGYEFELNYRNKIGAFGYSLKGTYSFAKNRIEFLDEVEPLYEYQRQTGKSIGTALQYVWTGQYYTAEEIANQSVALPIGANSAKAGYLKYADLNADGVIDQKDRAYTGRPNLPNTNIGITPGFSYKGFSISALFQAALNFDVQIGRDLATPFKANLSSIHLGRWTPETASTATFPALSTNFVGTYMSADNPSTFWGISGDYIRLRSIELGYQINNKFIKKLGLEGARIFANGYNIATWSKIQDRYNFDPEVVRGQNSGVYPTQKIYNLGINISIK